MRRESDSPVDRQGGVASRANSPLRWAPPEAVTVVPRSGWAPAASRVGTTSRRSRRRTVSGLMFSEQALSLGKTARSTARIWMPARARCRARPLPAGPAPAISTSTLEGSEVPRTPVMRDSTAPIDERRGQRRTHRRDGIDSVVGQPRQPPGRFTHRAAAVPAALGRPLADRTAEASLQRGPEQRVEQHAGDAADQADEAQTHTARDEHSGTRNHDSAQAAADAAAPADAPAGSRRHDPPGGDGTRFRPAARAEGGGPGISRGSGQRRGCDGKADWKPSPPERPRGRGASIGKDLPGVASIPLGIPAAGGVGEEPRNDGGGNEKGQQHYAATPTLSHQHRGAD